MQSRALEERYEELCRQRSDMNEHLPVLRDLARRCVSTHVTELGLRGGVSTTALLAGLADGYAALEYAALDTPQCLPPFVPRLVSYDVDEQAVQTARLGILQHVAQEAGVDFAPVLGDSLEVAIEGTDLLLIDSLHTYRQLRGELERHADRAREWIVFHDTATFGEQGEDGTRPGLMQAIREWLSGSPEWETYYHYEHCNGLLVARRRGGWIEREDAGAR